MISEKKGFVTSGGSFFGEEKDAIADELYMRYTIRLADRSANELSEIINLLSRYHKLTSTFRKGLIDEKSPE